MIRREWKEPNVRVVAFYRRGSARTWITRGESPDAVRRRLEDAGWTVERAAAFDYVQWQAKAAKLTRELVQAYERGETKLTFDDDTWRSMKSHLFELFDGKCAYCESKPLAVEPGDVEHYRPKGRVTDDVDHPGYYWLAYDIENLLPSCNECNRARGKWNQFPVEEGTGARTAAQLDAERPLLLHPYRDDPRGHFEYDPDGDVRGRTQRGTRSVEVCGLDRPQLCEMRRAAQEGLERELELEIIRDERSWHDIASSVREHLERGSEAYSAALLSHMLRFAAKVRHAKEREAQDKEREARDAASIEAALARWLGG